MTTTPSQDTTVRIIHAALTLGVVIFGVVTFVILRKTLQVDLPSVAINTLMVAAWAALGLGLGLVRPRIPRRGSDQSPNLYWSTAAVPAMMFWATLEFASMLGLVTYALSGHNGALLAAVVGLATLVVHYPGRLERN